MQALRAGTTWGRMMAALALVCSGCGQRDEERNRASAAQPVLVQRPADPAEADEGEAIFIGTVSSIRMLREHQPYYRFAINLKIDEVQFGLSPGSDFWFAVHSPAQERIKEGQRYRIVAKKSGDDWTLVSRRRWD